MSSNDSTFKQAMQILTVIEQQDPCRSQTQALIDGGHLAHLVKAAKGNRLPGLDLFTAFLKSNSADLAWLFEGDNLKVVAALRKDGVSFGNSPKPAPSTPSFMSVLATTPLDEAIGMSTKNCFTSTSRYAYRDSDFDSWLSKKQPPAPACTIATVGFKKDWTFVEAAAKVLGIGATSSVKLMGQALIENGHTMTPVQAENMVEKTESGVNTGMRTDGCANFFFVETGDPENPVSVASVNRDDSRWDANVFRLGGGYRWHADRRLLVRNLDASKL